MKKIALFAGCAGAVIAVPAAAQDANTGNGDPIVVTGRYTLPNKIDTATGLGLSIQETPQSVSIMTAQRIVDQNLITIKDVIQNAVGVSVNEFDDVRNNFYARGFQIRNTQVDGVPAAWTLAGATARRASTYRSTSASRSSVARPASSRARAIRPPRSTSCASMPTPLI
ncbi:TonB-dependent receptor plug domain-containing protein [Novosphingobium panipatense]|uniref:TonB-dependent receptor plug domain-containing protein n=1 Tax=Novosphingobium panipatense TaxID=428991 RepID=UPI00360E1D4B